MAWLAVDEDGTENIFSSMPYRIKTKTKYEWDYNYLSNRVELPKGTIKKLIGRELTWDDEPVELKEEDNYGITHK